tara:strand:- start:2958 stop:3527 length:570 start_codon:yes stop_codon:yes gene_type:complete
MNTITQYKGNSSAELLTNNDILSKFTELNKEKLTIIDGLPFYSGSEFQLPDTYANAQKMIDSIVATIDEILNTTEFTQSIESIPILEKEETPKSITYKKLLIRGIILIHWQLRYLETLETENPSPTPTRVNFVLGIFENLRICSKNYWGIDSEFTKSSITNVMTSLINNDELDVILMKFPTKALHVYGW